MKLVTLMIGAFLAPSLIAAEMVNLVCIKPVDDAFLANGTDFYQSRCDKYGDSMGNHCKKLAEAKKDVEDCKTATFGLKRVITINKSLLNQMEPQPIEQVVYSCKTRMFTYNGTVQKSWLVASPSFLQVGFTKEKLDFNIDRKDLSAGLGVERDYQCKIEEIDTSSNAI